VRKFSAYFSKSIFARSTFEKVNGNLFLAPMEATSFFCVGKALAKKDTANSGTGFER